MKEQGQKICARLGNPGQELSNGWIARFMGRYGISRKSEAAGDSLSKTMTEVDEWYSKKGHIETAGFSKETVSNLPETSKVSLDDERPNYAHEFDTKIPKSTSVSFRPENAEASLDKTSDNGSLVKKNEEVDELTKQGFI